jgi:hypothetical protein
MNVVLTKIRKAKHELIGKYREQQAPKSLQWEEVLKFRGQ